MNITPSDLKKIFLDEVPLIDVRAPVEYNIGSLPHSVNLPLLNDEERALVGTTYKKEGKDAAIALGHKLVSEDTKNNRMRAWIQFIKQNPHSIIYCFRGGLRSQTTQRWLKEAGYNLPIIEGGYKRSRNFYLDSIQTSVAENSFFVLSGTTGNGKTHLVNEVSAFFPSIDLEGIAQHKGSAFGGFFAEQPTQINFENLLSLELMKTEEKFKKKTFLIEDESRLIGRCALPEVFFQKQRISPVLILDEPIEVRVENIFYDYILQTDIGRLNEKEGLELFKKYQNAVRAISKKLGGLRTDELLVDLQQSETDFITQQKLESNRIWIRKLLIYYYDPLYLNSLEKRSPKVLIKGRRKEIIEWLHNK